MPTPKQPEVAPDMGTPVKVGGSHLAERIRVASRRLTKALLSALPSVLRTPLLKAYLWNRRTAIYDSRISADDVRTAVTLWRVLAFRYGYLRSLAERRCVRADGSPVPWFTYPAIEFLESLDLSGCRVFEFGAGNSTLFWAARAAIVHAVEANAEWHKKVASSLPAHCSVSLATTISSYVDEIARDPEGYDVVVIDGQNEEQGRYRCCAAALKVLRPGGMIILDNSECLPRSLRLLREAQLIEVPLSGFSPLNHWTTTTTVFLTRTFSMPRIPDKRWPLGAPHNVWEGQPEEIVVDAPNDDVHDVVRG